MGSLVASLLLVAMPSSLLAPSSDARSPSSVLAPSSKDWRVFETFWIVGFVSWAEGPQDYVLRRARRLWLKFWV